MIDTHNLVIQFGKYKGERWTRIPVSYLRWIVNEFDGDAKSIAESELKRRGTTIPTELVLSGHAIDRASQITKAWKKEGVHSWLTKISNKAFKKAGREEEIVYKGYKFVFAYGRHFPSLKTIIKKSKAK